MTDVSPILLSIFVPCYNEEKNIYQTLETISLATQSIVTEILVVDDGSVDRTSEEVERYCNANPKLNVRLLRRQNNHGLGAGFFFAVEQALGTFFMLVPGDNVKPYEHLAKIVSKLGESDLVIPFFGEGDNRNQSRILLSKSFTGLVNLLSGNHIKYYNGAVVHKTSILKEIPFRTSGFGYQAEIICWALKKYKLTYLHVQVPILEKIVGSGNAFRLKNILSVLMSLVKIFLRRINFIK